MGTTAQKLEYLGTTKSQEATMINYGLQDADKITNSTTFRQYVNKIKEAFLESLRNPDTLFTNLPKKSGTGANITLNDTANAPMRIELGASELSQSGTPTPSSPQDIHTISGSNKVVVEGQNIFDIGTSSDYSNPRTTIVNNVANIIISPSGQTIAWNTKNKYVGNKTYTFSGIGSASYSRVFVRLRKLDDSGYMTSSDTSITGWQYNSFYGGWFIESSSATFKYTVNIGNCLYWQFGIGYSSSVGEGTTQTISQIQILYGDYTNTDIPPYQSYKEPQEQEVDLKSENLLDISQSEQGGIDSSGAEITGNAFWRSTNYIKVKPNTVYFLSCNSKWTLRLYQYTSTKTFISPRTEAGNSVYLSITTGSTTEYLRWSLYLNGNEITKEAVENMNLMLTEGNILPIYEEYRDIDYCKISAYEDKFIRNSGKNKLPYTKNPVNETISNVKRTGNLGIYELSGTASGGGGSAVKYELKDLYTIKDGDYLHFGNEVSNGNSTLNLFDENGISILSYSPAPANRILSLSNYVGQTIKYIGFYNNASFTGTLILKPMILNTNEATEFEPYGSNEWYIKKNIFDKVFDGNMSLSYNGTAGQFYRTQQSYIPNYMSGTPILCNLLSYSSTSWNLNGIGITASNTFWLYIENGPTNSADMDTWLTTHNLIIKYVASTPTYTKITGTLTTQLENVYQKMLSQAGQTNISQVNNDLSFNMSVQAIEK